MMGAPLKELAPSETDWHALFSYGTYNTLCYAEMRIRTGTRSH